MSDGIYSQPTANGSIASLSSVNSTTELDTTQIVQIEKFVLKKEWIDSKIQLISTLPIIKPNEPLPPKYSQVGKQEFDQWWSEHEEIERDITEYDKGDFEGLRKLALAASKRNLSPKDTDLIDITLTTVFALDKLLHLLKDRRTRLDSLRLRLQWESELQAYRKELETLFKEEIPKYLTRARWTKPNVSVIDVGGGLGEDGNSVMRGRKDSLGPLSRSVGLGVPGSRRGSLNRLSMFMNLNNSGELESHSSTDNALTPAKGSKYPASLSLSSNNVSNSTPARTNPRSVSSSYATSTPVQPETASTMSRQLLADSLSLSLSPLTARLTQLNNTLLPASGKTLDLMIAKGRLPDEFFDVQDELEERAPKEVEGVGGFLGEVCRQWKRADEVWFGCLSLSQECKMVIEGIDLAFTEQKIEEDRCKMWEGTLREMKAKLGQLRRLQGQLQMPKHRKFEEQEKCNIELKKMLEEKIKQTEMEVRVMERRVEDYRFAVESVKRGQRVLKGVTELNSVFERDITSLRRELEEREVAGRPGLESVDPKWTEHGGKEEDGYVGRVKKLEKFLKSHISSTPSLQNDVSLALRDLVKAGVDEHLRNEMKRRADELQRRAEEAKREMDRWWAWYNTLVKEGRKTWDACVEREDELKKLEEQWRNRCADVRWEEEKGKMKNADEEKDHKTLRNLREKIDTACLPIRSYFPSLYTPDLSNPNTTIAVPKSLFDKYSYNHIPDLFYEKEKWLNVVYERVKKWQRFDARLRQQRRGAETFDEQMENLRSSITTFRASVIHKDQDLGLEHEDAAERQLEMLRQREKHLTNEVPVIISFVESQEETKKEPVIDIPFDVSQHDESLRNFVHKELAILGGDIDKLGTEFTLWKERRKMRRLRGKLQELDRKAEEVRVGLDEVTRTGLEGDVEALVPVMKELGEKILTVDQETQEIQPTIVTFDQELLNLSIDETECERLVPTLISIETKCHHLKETHTKVSALLDDELFRRENIRQGWLSRKTELISSLPPTDKDLDTASTSLQIIGISVKKWQETLDSLQMEQEAKLANQSVKEFILFSPVTTPSLDHIESTITDVAELLQSVSSHINAHTLQATELENSSSVSFLRAGEEDIASTSKLLEDFKSRFEASQAQFNDISSQVQNMRKLKSDWEKRQQDLQRQAEEARVKRINDLNDWSSIVEEIRTQIEDLSRTNSDLFQSLNSEIESEVSLCQNIYSTSPKEPSEQTDIDHSESKYSALQSKLQQLESKYQSNLSRLDKLEQSFLERCENKDLSSELSVTDLVQSVHRTVEKERATFQDQGIQIIKLQESNEGIMTARERWLELQRCLRDRQDSARKDWREGMNLLIRNSLQQKDSLVRAERVIGALRSRCSSMESLFQCTDDLQSDTMVVERGDGYDLLSDDCTNVTIDVQAIVSVIDDLEASSAKLLSDVRFPDRSTDSDLKSQAQQTLEDLFSRRTDAKLNLQILLKNLQTLKELKDAWLAHQRKLQELDRLAKERAMNGFRNDLSTALARVDTLSASVSTLEEALCTTLAHLDASLIIEKSEDIDNVEMGLQELRLMTKKISLFLKELNSLEDDKGELNILHRNFQENPFSQYPDCLPSLSKYEELLKNANSRIDKAKADYALLQSRVISSTSAHERHIEALHRVRKLIDQRHGLDSAIDNLVAAISNAEISYITSSKVPNKDTTQELVQSLKDLSAEVESLETPYEAIEGDLSSFIANHKAVSLDAPSAPELSKGINDLSHRVYSTGTSLRSLNAKVKSELERRIELFHSHVQVSEAGESGRSSTQPTSMKGRGIEDISNQRDIFAQLRTRLGALRVDGIDVSTSEGHVLRPLPTVRDFDEVQKVLVQLSNQAEDLEEDSVNQDELDIFMRDLRKKQRELEVMSQLAEVAGCLDTCDHIFSDLLDSLDDIGPDSDSGPSSHAVAPIQRFTQSTSLSSHSADSNKSIIERVFKNAKSSVEALHQASAPVSPDCRVKRHLARIDQTWEELSSLVLDITGNSPASSISGASVKRAPLKKRELPRPIKISPTQMSSPQSVTGLKPHSLPRRVPSIDHLSPRTPTHPRKVSGPSTSVPRPKSAFGISSFSPVRLPASPQTVQATPWGKSVGQRFASTLSPVNDTFPSISSKVPVTPTSQQLKPPVRKRTTSTITARTRKTSTISNRPSKRPNNYKANPKRQVDVQVGKIVNEMPMQITIAPVENEPYQDQCGRYWIGDKDPKLCFCRILRSSTVMVRVGGGWQELGSFLLAHFSSSFGINVSSSKGNEERWLSSSTVQQAQAQINELANSTNSPATPRVSLSSRVSLPGQDASSPQPPDKFSLFMHKYDSPPKSKKVTIPWR